MFRKYNAALDWRWKVSPEKSVVGVQFLRLLYQPLLHGTNGATEQTRMFLIKSFLIDFHDTSFCPEYWDRKKTSVHLGRLEKNPKSKEINSCGGNRSQDLGR